MQLIMSIGSTFKLCSEALEECIVRAMGFVKDDSTIDWLGYYRYCHERMLIASAARQNNPVMEVQTYGALAEEVAQAISDITARLKDMWLKRLHEDSRASQSEGRFISLMASMPVPPTKTAFVSSSGWNTNEL